MALLALGAVLGAVGFAALGRPSAAGGPAGAEPVPRAEAAAQKGGDKDPHAADRAALRKTMQSFIKAFESGDAKAVAGHWTDEGEYVADDGTVIRGRAAIEKAYAEMFGASKTSNLDIDSESVRFLSRDTAVEEGHFTLRRGKEAPTASRYSVLYVRDSGTWRMAIVREWPGEGDSLRALGWLVGKWVAKRPDAEVHTTYEWWGNKAFLRVTFTVKEKDHTLSGFQMIGKDPATGRLRSWTFEYDGGFGAADWSRDGNKWVLDSAGVLANGSTVSATNIFTRLDDDSFTWQSIHRTADGAELPDLAPIKVMRLKEKK
jgi:uncharacterized protein (TIGR02246 family)